MNPQRQQQWRGRGKGWLPNEESAIRKNLVFPWLLRSAEQAKPSEANIVVAYLISNKSNLIDKQQHLNTSYSFYFSTMTNLTFDNFAGFWLGYFAFFFYFN